MIDECVLLSCVRLSFFQYQAKRLASGNKTSSKWPILCRVGRKTTTQSIGVGAGVRSFA